jgi:hypothetical protein
MRGGYGVARLGALSNGWAGLEGLADEADAPGDADLPFEAWKCEYSAAVAAAKAAAAADTDGAGEEARRYPPTPQGVSDLLYYGHGINCPPEFVELSLDVADCDVPGAAVGEEGTVPARRAVLERFVRVADRQRQPKLHKGQAPAAMRRPVDGAELRIVVLPTSPDTEPHERIRPTSPMRHPDGKESWPSRETYGERTNEIDHYWLQQAGADDKRRHENPGRLDRGTAGELVFDPSEIPSPWLRDELDKGKHVDTSNPKEHRMRQIGDERVGLLDMAWLRARLAGRSPARRRDFTDRAIAYEGEWGIRIDSVRTRGLTAHGVNFKSTGELPAIWKQMLKDDAHYVTSRHFANLPGAYNPLGLIHVWTKAKPRGKTNLSWPLDRVDSAGRSLSVNGGVDMDDETLHARVEWLSLSGFRLGAGVVYHVYLFVSEAHPEVEYLLRPCGFAEDNTAYYRYFACCVRDRFVQGVIITPPGAARALVKDTGVGAFGGRTLPHKGHRFAMVETEVIMVRVFKFESMVVQQAAAYDESGGRHGDKRCAAIAPLQFRELVSRRAAALDDGDEAHLRFPMLNAKFLDDRGTSNLGATRALALVWVTWIVTWGSLLALAIDKFQFGEMLDLLGLHFMLRIGLLYLTEAKEAQCTAWLERLINLEFVEYDELEQAWGTFGFAVTAIEGGRKLLSPGYRLLHQPLAWYPRKGRGICTRVSDGMRTNLRALLQKVVEARGVAFLKERPSLIPTDPSLALGCTDSNRPRRVGVYGGMGGMVFYAGCVYYWMVRFDQEVLDDLPVHVTEFWAELTQVAIVAQLLDAREYVEYCDNGATTAAIWQDKARDPRFQDALVLREGQLQGEREAGELVVETHSIPSKENGDADDLSRGRERRFLSSMAKLGLSGDRVVKVELHMPDYEELRQRFLDTTRAMPDRRTRSKDRFHSEL